MRKHPVLAPLLAAATLLSTSCALRSKGTAGVGPDERRLIAAVETGDAALAEERLQKAVASAERRHGPDRPALADSLDRFADALTAEAVRSPRSLALVESLRRRALDLRVAALGAGDVRVGESQSRLSAAYFDEGRFALAEEHERKALATFESAPEGRHSSRTARSLGDLATILFLEGRYREASFLQDRALSILEALGNASPQELAKVLNVTMEIRRVEGRYEEAEKAGRHGLERARAGPEIDETLVADLLNNLAGLFKDQARYDEAEATYREVMSLWQRDAAANAFSLSIGYLNQADIFRLQGRLEEATSLFGQALEMAERQLADTDPALAMFLNRSALVRAEQGLYAGAEPLYRRALDLLERTTPGHPDVAQTLHDLAGLRAKRGELEDAEDLYRRAAALRATVFGEAHPEVAPSLTELARCLHRRGPEHDAAALELLSRAVTILSEVSVYPETLSDALALRAEIQRTRGDAEGARESLARSLAVVEDMRPRTGGSDATRADFLARYAAHFHRMASWLLEAGRVEEALGYAERGRARVLLDQLALAGVDLTRDIPEPARRPLLRRELDARARLAELQARLAFTASRGDVAVDERASEGARLSVDIDAAAREVQQASSALRRASPLWQNVVTAGGRPATLAEMRSALLAPDRLLLYYLVGDTESAVVAVPGEGAPFHRTLRLGEAEAATLGVPAGPLSEAALAAIFREGGEGLAAGLGRSRGLSRTVDREGSAGGLPSRLQALFRALVPRDLWPVIVRAHEVLVVPDGALHGLPFEALVVALSPDGRPAYWLDEGPVVGYAPSATTACNLARRREERGNPDRSALVVANPLFAPAADSPPASVLGTRQRLGSLPPLPGTAAEAARIRHALEAAGGEVVVLSDAGAGEAAVRGALASRTRTYLHFATHGLVQQGGNELLAALALTAPGRPAPPADDDGLLQLFEIYELDARSEVTVLSACDSHTGRQVMGEGVFALSRAFLAAGARRVVASLWPVDDSSTAYLMGTFYERVAGAAGPGDVAYARALRDARREVRGKAEWSHPYYWAPFVATGAR